MSAFSEAALEKKLSELSNSQQSVQTLSLWLIHHRKHSQTIVTVWLNELKKGTVNVLVCYGYGALWSTTALSDCPPGAQMHFHKLAHWLGSIVLVGLCLCV